MRNDATSLRRRTSILFASALLFLGTGRARADDDVGSGRVEIVKTPDGGIQPQAVADRRGPLHLIYFKGEPSRGDLFYVKRNPDQKEFTKPIRVNSVPGAAVATGTIRGGQIALGAGGKVHVAWNGSVTDMKNPAPMLYARLKAGEDGFEPQKSLMKVSTSLDGGGTVAADDAGRVYVAWHARGVSEPAGEDRRKLWVARSTDEGVTFDAERPALDQRTGACACCGTRALADSNGKLSILFRAATAGVDRDIYLVSSRDGGEHFTGRSLHPWRLNACPMSSESLADGGDGPIAAWETAGQVYFTRVAPSSDKPPAPVAPPGRPGNRKHPAIAVAPDGSTLLAWTEGTGWQKGGSLAWQLFDPSGRPTDLKGRVDGGIPVWGLPTVVAGPDGRFTIIH
jgi:hypothetical protein